MAENHLTCSVDDCNGKAASRGLCSKHYRRFMRHGTTDLQKKYKQLDWLIGLVCGGLSCACIEWPFYCTKRHGYGRMWFDNKPSQAHRVSLILHSGGEPSKKMHAAHECHNKKCVNPLHLRWATPKENERDKTEACRQSRGEDHHKAKLSRDQAVEIFVSSEKQGVLAKKYGVDQTAVSLIKRRVNWAHATEGLIRGTFRKAL